MSFLKEIFTKPKQKSMSAKEYRDMAYNKMSEEQHQEQLIYWLDKQGIYYEVSSSGIWLPNPHRKNSVAWHLQNKFNKISMAKMKKTGLNKGQSDLKVYLKSIELQIELKSMRGKASVDQLKVQKIISKTTYAKYEVIRGYLDAIKLIEIGRASCRERV